MTSLKTSIKTITYLSDTGCLEIQGASLYMALVSDQGNSVAAKKVLLTLWDYMSTPDQIKRMQDVISNPKRLDGVPGQMNAVHIRFDSNSPVMADVQEEGKPQLWNHKQNDALGLYLDLLIQAIDTGLKCDSRRLINRMSDIC